MKTLLILNDPAYGTERSYNGLRLAGSLARRDDGKHAHQGGRKSSLEELTDWTEWADKVITF